MPHPKSLLFLCIVACLTLCSTSSPLPDNFTYSQAVHLGSGEIASRVFYSPDQNSIIYTVNGSCFHYRMGLLQPYDEDLQTTICVDLYISNIAYSPLGDRVYMISSDSYNPPVRLSLSYFTITNGTLSPTMHTVHTMDGSSSNTRLQVSHNNDIAVVNDVTLSIISVSPTGQVDVRTQIFRYTLQKMFKWHPIDKEILIFGCCEVFYNNAFFFNVTSRLFTNLTDIRLENVDILLYGQLIAIEPGKYTPDNQSIINLYSWNQGKLELVGSVQGYKMVMFEEQRLSAARSNLLGLVKQQMDNVKYADAEFFEVLITDQVEEIEEVEEAYQSVKSLKTVESIRHLLRSIKRGNKVSSSLPQQQKYTFNLITSLRIDTKYTSDLIDGSTSPDGNDIYLRANGNSTVLRWTRCPDGTYKSTAPQGTQPICLACSSECLFCHLEATKCTTCSSGHYYYDEKCPKCITHHTGCLTCSYPKCFTCDVESYFKQEPINGSCVCINSYVQVTDPENNTTTCEPCSSVLEGCNTCSDTQTCTQCIHGSDGYKLDEQTKKCVKPDSGNTWVIVVAIVGAVLVVGLVGFGVYWKKCRKGKGKGGKYNKFREENADE